MTGTDVLNLVPDEARKVATAYLKGLARGIEIQTAIEAKKKEDAKKEEKQ